jgi:Tol biopolymer transport system component
VFVVDLDASLAAEGPSRRLTKEAVFRITGLAWSRDGRSVIYDTEAVPFVHYLWRVGADGGYPPERMEVAGVGARLPATVPSRDRLVFTRDLDDIDIYRFQVGRSPEPVVASSGLPDGGAQYSPDGRRIAFASARSGDAVEIWVANADGSGEQQLTYRHRPFGGNPRWSPDGRRIAFDSQDADGHWHIWIVAADGGAPQRVTTDTADENVPTWSRDGRWVYFAVKSRETQDIWKVSSQGGVKQRVTQGGSALFACESADGKSLLYQATTGDQSPLLALPLAGGAARQLVACVKSTAFAEGPQGIYFLGCDPGPSPRVHLRDRVTGKDELLGTLEQLEPGWPVLGLGVSPDGTSILYAKDVREGGDLMLIENFR